MPKIKKTCYVCDKTPLTKDEIGLTKKLLNRNPKYYYCTACLADYLEVDEEFLLIKVEEFKDEGCALF
ncbi:MAG: DUF2197 domain-containing protein [Defluviitaleaceae bacterium]|nr:DUF2197 domain-containing protein [Defluviitaleaceae bacterium]